MVGNNITSLQHFFNIMVCMNIMTLNELRLTPYFDEFGRLVDALSRSVMWINHSVMDNLNDKVLWSYEDMIQEISERLIRNYDNIAQKVKSLHKFYSTSYTKKILINFIIDVNRKKSIENLDNNISLDSKVFSQDEADTFWKDIIKSDSLTAEEYAISDEENAMSIHFMKEILFVLANSGRDLHKDRVVAFMILLHDNEIFFDTDIKEELSSIKCSDKKQFITAYNHGLEKLSDIVHMDHNELESLKADSLNGFGRNFSPSKKTSKYISYWIGDSKKEIYKKFNIDPSDHGIDHINIAKHYAKAVLLKLG